MAMSKTTSKIALDWSRLLGFDQAPRDAGGRAAAPGLTRAGGKIGVKTGGKIGSKPGLKRRPA